VGRKDAPLPLRAAGNGQAARAGHCRVRWRRRCALATADATCWRRRAETCAALRFAHAHAIPAAAPCLRRAYHSLCTMKKKHERTPVCAATLCKQPFYFAPRCACWFCFRRISLFTFATLCNIAFSSSSVLPVILPLWKAPDLSILLPLFFSSLFPSCW